MPQVLHDGVDLLPDLPGIYAIFNRVTGRRAVGMASRSIRTRAMQHRRSFLSLTGCSAPIARDLAAHGADAFIFLALEICPRDSQRSRRVVLRARELWWAEQLLTLDERSGYNLEAGGVRSRASRLRDLERKFLRSNSRRYELLPAVCIDDPVNPEFLRTWIASARSSSY